MFRLCEIIFRKNSNSMYYETEIQSRVTYAHAPFIISVQTKYGERMLYGNREIDLIKKT
jgi:hypothetical protein